MALLPRDASQHDPQSLIAELRARNGLLRRQVLEPDVLQAALPIRARAVACSRAQPDRLARERRFHEASPTYARAMADTADRVANSCVTVVDSLKWWVPLTAPDDPVQVEHYLTHQNFPYRAIAQTREVALGGTMIDIGANIGRMSVPRVILGDATVAYCAEPDPLNHTCLVRNVRDNDLTGLVLPDQLAIGAEDGIARLERAKSPGGHKLIRDHVRSRREVLEVRCLTLDSWIDVVNIDLDLVRFVKVDVQGAEVDVLRGSSRVLARKYIVWQIEVDAQTLVERGSTKEELFAILQAEFTHFVDLNRRAIGPRIRPVRELAESLAYAAGGKGGRTDVLMFALEPGRLD